MTGESGRTETVQNETVVDPMGQRGFPRSAGDSPGVYSQPVQPDPLGKTGTRAYWESPALMLISLSPFFRGNDIANLINSGYLLPANEVPTEESDED